MKILITTFTYPPNKDGVAEACRQMAEGLAELGWDVHVVTGILPRSSGGLLTPQIVHGVHIHRFDLDLHSSHDSEGKQEIDRYQSFVNCASFDVIVNQCWEAWPTVYLEPLVKSSKTKWVQVSHGYSMHIYTWYPFLTMGLGRWLRGLKWTLMKLPMMIRNYDCLIFLSKRMDSGRFFDHFVASFLKHPGIHIVPNGTEVGKFPPHDQNFRTRHQIGAGPMFLYVANYCERKNQKLAVTAFRKANIPGSTLVFVGTELNGYGKECIELDRRLQHSYPGGRTLFLDESSREETLAAYVASDVFLLTANAETQPIVLIEAMAAGKPWISTKVGCVPDMQGGIVCQSKADLTQAILLLANDRDQCNNLGLTGKQAALAEHQVHLNAREFDRIFRNLL